MADLNPFSPIGNTVAVASSTSSARSALTLGGPSALVRVYNDSSTTAFVKLGSSTVAASASADLPIPSGGSVLLSGGGLTYGAAILATGTGNVYFTTGLGF